MWDSERGVAAPDLSWHWCPSNVASTKSKTRCLFEQSDCFCNLDNDLCLHFIVKSALALQCNPVCTYSASSVCCLVTCVRTLMCVWVSWCVWCYVCGCWLCVWCWSGVLLTCLLCSLEACFFPDP